jgi:enoyl-CoA hydratase
MTESCFAVSIENNVAHIVLNRPQAFNAMPRPFWNELPVIVNDINDNAKARVIVISSTGKHFTAGMDISVFTDGDGVSASGGDQYSRAEAFRQFVLKLQNTFSCLDNVRIPVIAAIQGGCIGAGVDMTSACDIRYCTEDAFFQIAEINIGMTADVGTFPRLCKLIPEGWVRELAYAGRRLPAAKAKEIGLVNDTFATQEAMLAHVMELAH